MFTKISSLKPTILVGFYFLNFNDFLWEEDHNKAMRLNLLIKKPFLAMGILMLAIFFFQLKDKGWLSSMRKARLTPSSCRALLVKLNRRIPKNWSTGCEGKLWNNLAISITLTPLKIEGEKELRAYLYREMANNLIHIARHSPSDNLERTHLIRLQMIHPQREINALSEGHLVAQLATLKDKELIAQHLRSSVQVQERIK